MTTATDDAAALAAAKLKAAQDDLAALLAFQAIATNQNSTIGAMESAGQVLLASIGDPGRLQAVQSIMGGYQTFLGQLATIVAQTNAAAGN